jgi:hypothetical protein
MVPPLALIVRERQRPESQISSHELYCILALAEELCLAPYTDAISVSRVMAFPGIALTIYIGSAVCDILALDAGPHREDDTVLYLVDPPGAGRHRG